jgi:peptide/nickel transport system substrate-binding protein
MRVTRPAAIAVAGVLAVAGLTACGGGSSSDSSSSATTVLNVGMPNGPQTNNSNPFLGSSSGAKLGYRYMIFEPLVMTSQIKPAEPGKPWLATKWEWSDNYKKLVLTVRDKVKWSDGQAFGAEDVAYTFTMLKGLKALNQDAIPYGDITAAGNQVTLTFPSSQFVNETKILKTVMVPSQWSTMKDPATDTVANPIGTGPYTLKSFTPQTVTLSVRDTYWQDLPKVKELRYTSYNDNNAQTTALASGACEWSFVFIPNYKAVYTSKDPKNLKLWFPSTLAMHGLWINTTKKPFDDPKLRQAMNMVVNRDDIFMQGEAGYFYPKVDNITGIPLPAGKSFLAPEYKDKTVKVDVEGAKKLLTEAGYRNAGQCSGLQAGW